MDTMDTDEGKEIKPIFSADMNNPKDMALLKKYFSAGAIDRAFEDGDGHKNILDNAAKARLEQSRNKTQPENLAHGMNMLDMWEVAAAIKRQTRESDGTEITGIQGRLF